MFNYNYTKKKFLNMLANDPDIDTATNMGKNEVFIKEPSFLEVVQNRIYFYSEVDRENVLKLNKVLRELNNSILYDCQVKQTPKEGIENIYLHINSYGGGIFEGLACVDAILKSDVKVATIVDGCCASSATLFSVVGSKRYINKHAFMLIHQLSNIMWGKHEECKDEIQNQEMLMSTIKGIYKEYTKVPESKLEEILKHDLWFDAKTCLEYSLVDEIL